MIVRCGRCQVELEVQGAGEFICPSCGTRNAVRGPAGAGPGLDPYGLPDLGAVGTKPPSPFGTPSSEPPSPQGDEPTPGITWETCPDCTYRFARGQVEEISCPSCGVKLQVGPDGSLVQQGSG